MNLDSAYIMDPSSGRVQSQEESNFADAIAERYPHIRLAGAKDRDDPLPYALIDTNTGAVLKELKRTELTINFVFKWLFEHDTARHGEKKLYDQYIADKKKREDDKKYAAAQALGEQLEFVNSMASSEKHYFRHGKRKFGEI